MMRYPNRTNGETVTTSHHEASIHAPERVADDSVHARRLSHLGFALAVVWLLFLVFPLVGLYEMRYEPARLLPAAAGIVFGSATYVWAAWRAVRSVAGTGAPISPRVLGVALGLLSLLGISFPLLYGDNWVGLLGFVGILVGLTLPFGTVLVAAVTITLLTAGTAVAAGLDWGPTVSTTIYSGLSIFIAFGVRWLVVTNRELRTARREIERLAVSEERLRLSQEIHDTLTQGFASIKMHASPARHALTKDPGAAERHLVQIDRTARESLEEARRLVWALRPEPLQGTPLPDALERLARRFSEESGTSAEFSVTGTPGPLGPDLEVTLLRIAQEALSNALKHAQASRLAVTLSYLEDAVALDVRDDGVGFDPAQKRKPHHDSKYSGMGLTGMRERIEALGGMLAVESSSGEGTVLAVELPLEAEQVTRSARAAKE